MTEVVTTGQKIHSFHTLAGAFVDEYKLKATDVGVETAVVDPANVAYGEVTLLGEGLAMYDHDPVEGDVAHGVRRRTFGNAIDAARVGRGSNMGDSVTLSLGERTVSVNVDREDSALTRSKTLFGIDPDTMRSDYDYPNDLNLPATAVVDPQEFYEAVKLAEEGGEYAALYTDSGDLKVDVRGEDEAEDDVFTFEGAVTVNDDPEAAGEGSYFSLDYMRDAAKAIKNAKMERVTVSIGQEFPAEIGFEHTEWGVEGLFGIAPRVQSE